MVVFSTIQVLSCLAWGDVVVLKNEDLERVAVGTFRPVVSFHNFYCEILLCFFEVCERR